MINQRIKSSKGITIVALIVTIIIALILSGTIIYTIKTSNDISPYNRMAEDIELLQDKILIYYNKYQEVPKKGSQFLINGKAYYEIDLSKLGAITLNFGSGVDQDDIYLVNNNLEVYYKKGINKNGVIVHTIENEEYEEPINEYGFYYNKEYICNDYSSQRINDYAIIVIYPEASSTTTIYEEYGLTEGQSISFYTIAGSAYTTINSLEYNTEYTGTGSFNETYKAVVDSGGNLTTTIEFPTGSLTFSTNTVTVANTLTGTFSNNGMSLSFLNKTFAISDETT